MATTKFTNVTYQRHSASAIGVGKKWLLHSEYLGWAKEENIRFALYNVPTGLPYKLSNWGNHTKSGNWFQWVVFPVVSGVRELNQAQIDFVWFHRTFRLPCSRRRWLVSISAAVGAENADACDGWHESIEVVVLNPTWYLSGWTIQSISS